MSGCNAQEEHLCRCSNLLPQLEVAEVQGYYPLYSRRPGVDVPDVSVLAHNSVTFFRHPARYDILPRNEWFKLGVLTAAAEKVRGPRQLGPNAERFIGFLIQSAVLQQCTHVVLSAWGCGAFGQCPYAVAQCFRRALARFAPAELSVYFAILDDHNSDGNLAAFRQVFSC